MKVYNKTVIDWLFGRQQFAACSFGQQIRPRVKQNCCCPRTQSITVYYYPQQNTVQWKYLKAWKGGYFYKINIMSYQDKKPFIYYMKTLNFFLSLNRINNISYA